MTIILKTINDNSGIFLKQEYGRSPIKIIKNQGQFFLLLKRMQRRCIGEAKKKKIRVESVGTDWMREQGIVSMIGVPVDAIDSPQRHDHYVKDQVIG